MCYSEKLATTTSTILRVIFNLKDKLQTAPCILPILHCVYALKTLNLAFFYTPQNSPNHFSIV